MGIMDKKHLTIIYEITMAFLSIIVAIILILDYSIKLSHEIIYYFNMIDNLILIIFALDYFIRLYLSKNKKKFFKENIIDLIAIIPFGSIFQALRVADIFKILKIFRSIVFFAKFRSHINNFIKTNNFGYIIFITIFVLFLGTIGMHLSEGIPIGNALWLSFVTITTVGYGDISPSTTSGKFIAGFLMITGIGFLSMLTGTISTYFLSRNRNKSYKYQVIENIKEELDNFDKLSNEDIDNICSVLKTLKTKPSDN